MTSYAERAEHYWRSSPDRVGFRHGDRFRRVHAAWDKRWDGRSPEAAPIPFPLDAALYQWHAHERAWVWWYPDPAGVWYFHKWNPDGTARMMKTGYEDVFAGQDRGHIPSEARKMVMWTLAVELGRGDLKGVTR